MSGVVSYAGLLFRTELHARWAVFLDALNLAWEYIGAEDVTFRVPGACEGLAVVGERMLTEAQTTLYSERSHDGPISVFCGTVALPVYQETSHGTYYWGSWAYDFGQPLNGTASITAERLRAFRLARRSCWQERLADGSFLVWPVPACEPVPPGEPQPQGTTTLILPGGMAMPVFDPIKARRKALDSPRLRAAYIAAKTACF